MRVMTMVRATGQYRQLIQANLKGLEEENLIEKIVAKNRRKRYRITPRGCKVLEVIGTPLIFEVRNVKNVLATPVTSE